MKSIEEMNDVIQDFCDRKSCSACEIRSLCDSVAGDFEGYPTQCKEAYEIIMSLSDFTANNPVNHPSHYNKGKIEVWDFISDWKLNFDRGNAIKYICRAGSKDPEKEIQDLEKAIEYINHEIKTLKGETENGT
jgi:hypothetical protein